MNSAKLVKELSEKFGQKEDGGSEGKKEGRNERVFFPRGATVTNSSFSRERGFVARNRARRKKA